MPQPIIGGRLTTQSDLFNGINSQRFFGKGYSETIWNLAPEKTPLLTMLNMFKRVGSDVDFWWNEDRPSWLSDLTDTVASGGTFTTTDAVGTTKTDLVFTTNGASGAGTDPVNAGQIWMIQDADDMDKFILIYLKSFSSTWTARLLTVPEFTVAAGDVMTLTSIAYAEGSDYAKSKYETISKKWGSCQNFKESYDLSYEIQDSSDITYNDPIFQETRALERLKVKIEKAITWGSGRYSDVSNDPWGTVPATNIVDSDGLPVRLTASLDQCIRRCEAVNSSASRVHKIVSSAATYIDDIVTKAEDIFRYTDNVHGVCGMGFKTFMQRLALLAPSQFTLSTNQTEFGIEINTLDMGHGKVHFAVNKDFKLNASLNKRAYLFDLNSLSLMVSREIWKDEIKTSRSKNIWQFEGRYGLKVATPERHYILQVS